LLACFRLPHAGYRESKITSAQLCLIFLGMIAPCNGAPRCSAEDPMNRGLAKMAKSNLPSIPGKNSWLGPTKTTSSPPASDLPHSILIVSHLLSLLMPLHHLDWCATILLIYPAVSLLLPSLLEYTCNRQQQQSIDSHDTKIRREDHIQVDVGERTEWANAPLQICGDQRVGASAVLNERWGSEVEVTAALEFLLEEGLRARRLCGPDGQQVGAGPERFEPDGQTENERENSTRNDHVAVHFEEGTVGRAKAREREDKGDEYQDRVYDTGFEWT